MVVLRLKAGHGALTIDVSECERAGGVTAAPLVVAAAATESAQIRTCIRSRSLESRSSMMQCGRSSDIGQATHSASEIEPAGFAAPLPIEAVLSS